MERVDLSWGEVLGVGLARVGSGRKNGAETIRVGGGLWRQIGG